MFARTFDGEKNILFVFAIWRYFSLDVPIRSTLFGRISTGHTYLPDVCFMDASEIEKGKMIQMSIARTCFFANDPAIWFCTTFHNWIFKQNNQKLFHIYSVFIYSPWEDGSTMQATANSEKAHALAIHM